jgi:putative acetyltransferase
MMSIRPYAEQDLADIVAVFTDSVHHIASRSYTPEQLAAWAPTSPDLNQWRARLSGVETLVAESRGVIAGFLSFTSNGHIEFLFTAPTFARQGVASLLYQAAMQRLTASGVETLTTDASLEALPFFESRGLKVWKEQTVERNGVKFRRFAMTGPSGSINHPRSD